ncbi:hypothetical protein KAR91_71300 [Candidatus Pacearchaeota archaeon]|nr:hypothetical protein [Candidatus Pacearchaeota archaeon]
MIMHDSMKLPEGKTCDDCVHFKRCYDLFGAKPINIYCDFYPVRYYAKPINNPKTDS